MNYKIEFARRARRDLENLPKGVFERVMEAIDALAENPRPHGIKKLQGREGYRVRVGDYRVIYDIKDVVRIVRVERVAHRSDAYRN